MEPMNIHHLELFHHVALHGGINQALRHMPYGIQQPAVSAQLIRLEKDLGVTLFRRRPFALTPEGEALFEFARPFFSRLDEVEEALRHGTRHLRIAAVETVTRHFLPGPLKTLKHEFPDLRISLRGAFEHESLELLSHGEVDVVIGPSGPITPAGIETSPLAETRLALIVPDSVGRISANNFIKRSSGLLPLLALAPGKWISRIFQEELARQNLAWMPTWELSSLDLIQRYAEEGFGIGLTVEGAVSDLAAGFRLLTLGQFPKLRIVARHARKPDDVTLRLLETIRAEAKLLRRAGPSSKQNPEVA